MIISISGAPGSGKTTVAEKLAASLGWPRYYMGGIRREMARKRGLTIAEYNELGEKDPSTDSEVDEYVKKLGESGEDFVIESRTAWHFLPQSLKIYLDTDEKVAARRIFRQLQSENQRNEGGAPPSEEDVLASIRQRVASDDYRYRKYYQIDYRARDNYDFYLDASQLTPEETLNQVEAWVRSQLDSKKK